MDLRAYYKKVRDIEREIQEPFPIIVSLATPDGGRPGTPIETSPALAAKMVAQGAARLATAEEAQAFREKAAEERRLADQAAAASKVQLAVLTTSELSRLRNPGAKNEE